MNADTFEETPETITLHGLGFLQIKLAGRQRLHIWHPDLPRRSCFEHSAIHNHRFPFRSRVLIGRQINVDYDMAAGPSGGPPGTHVAYLHEGDRTAFGNRPWIPTHTITPVEAAINRYQPGEEYTMEALAYHATVPDGDGVVATLMRKEGEDARVGAHSLCSVGMTPDADFDRKQWPEDKLWSVALEVLGAAPASTLKLLDHAAGAVA